MPRSPRLTTALCCLAMMSLAIAVNILPPFFTTLATDLAPKPVSEHSQDPDPLSNRKSAFDIRHSPTPLSDEQLGRLGAITCLGLVLGILLTGPLADRTGPRPFTAAGNALIAAGLLLLSRTHTYPTALAAALTMGLGAGVLDMILSPIVAALHPTKRTASLNLLHSFYCAGTVATIAAARLALAHHLPWRTLALTLLPLPALLTLAFLPLPLPALHAPKPASSDSSFCLHPSSLSSLLRHPYLPLALLAIFLGGSAEMGLSYWLPAYAEKSLHFPRTTATDAFLGFAVAMTVGRLAIPLLPIAHTRPIPLMLASCSATTLLLLATSYAPAHLALAAAIGSGLAASCLWPTTLALAADRFPHAPPSLYALLAAFGNVGGVAMPWLIGALADHIPLRHALATATLCPLLMIPALLQMSRLTPKPARPVTPI